MTKKRFLLDKLGRDNMKELFKKDNCDLKFHIIDDNEEYLEILTQKIVEELEEVFDCETKEEVIEELADLEQVMIAFRKLIHVTREEVETVRKEKEKTHGGFEKRVYLEYADVPKNSKYYAKFMEDPEKYPEIVEEIKD